MASTYSGYTVNASAKRCCFKYSITLGEQPTVFSLKSRRSLPCRPPVGGRYGAIFCTAGRGVRPLPIPNLRGSRVRFQAFCACERSDCRCQFRESFTAEFLHRDDLDEI